MADIVQLRAIVDRRMSALVQSLSEKIQALERSKSRSMAWKGGK